MPAMSIGKSRNLIKNLIPRTIADVWPAMHPGIGNSTPSSGKFLLELDIISFWICVGY